MTEKDILQIIQNDQWMMGILKIARDLNLPQWIIGARPIPKFKGGIEEVRKRVQQKNWSKKWPQIRLVA